EAVLDAITAALHEQVQQAAAELRPANASKYDELNTEIRSSLDKLEVREDLVFKQLPSADVAAIDNLAAFNDALRKIGTRLLDRPLGDVYGLAFPKDTQPTATESWVDPALMRYSAKVALAATLAYVIAVASHRFELGVMVWITIFVAVAMT